MMAIANDAEVFQAVAQAFASIVQMDLANGAAPL